MNNMLQCLPYGMVSPPLNISCCKIRHFHPAFMLEIVFNFFFWHEEFVCKDCIEKAVSNFCILYSKSFQNWTNKPGHTNYQKCWYLQPPRPSVMICHCSIIEKNIFQVERRFLFILTSDCCKFLTNKGVPKSFRKWCYNHSKIYIVVDTCRRRYQIHARV